MAKAWQEVAASPEYQALPPDQQNAAREQYFSQVVAPQISDPAQVQQAKQQFDAQYGQPQADTLPPVTVHPSLMQQIGAGAADLGRAAVMTGRAAVHGALALPAALNDATLVPAINGISQAIGSDYREAPSSQQIDNLLNKTGLPNPQPQNSTERVVQGIDQGLGGLASGVGVGSLLSRAASPVAQGVGNALTSGLRQQTIATGVGTGASGAIREAGGSPTTQAVFGLAGGLTPAGIEGAGNGLASTLPRLMGKPSQEAADLARDALSRGIPLKATQVSPSKVGKLLDSVTGQAPLSGASNFNQAQQAGFNRAVAKTIGENSDKITSGVFDSARQRIGAMYDDLASRINPQITPDVQQKLDAVLADAKQLGSTDSANAMQNIAQRISDQSVNGALPGAAYKSIDSALGNIAKNGGEKGNYAGQLRQVLRDAFTDSATGPDQDLMATANRQYGNLKTIEPLVAKDSVEGNISPAQLLGRTNATKAGRASMARGTRGELGTLANIGQQFIKQQVPDSFTAPRSMAFKALGSLGSLGGGVAAGSLLGPVGGLATLGGAIGGSRLTQNLLQNPKLVQALLDIQQQQQGAPALSRAMNPALQSMLPSQR